MVTELSGVQFDLETKFHDTELNCHLKISVLELPTVTLIIIVDAIVIVVFTVSVVIVVVTAVVTVGVVFIYHCL